MLRKSFFIIVFIFSCATAAFSQSYLSGIWEGTFYTTVFPLDQPKLVVEINVYEDSLVSGITHLYYKNEKYEHYKMIGKYRKKDSLIIFTEASVIAVDLGPLGNCLGTYMMKVARQNNKLVQSGYWVSNIRGCSPSATVKLQKRPEAKKEITTPPQTSVAAKKNAASPPKKPTVSLIKKPAPVQVLRSRTESPVVLPSNLPKDKEPVVIKNNTATPLKISQRQTDVQSLLEISSGEKDSIKVEVYDNGEIDGDSVSVFEEENLRINKKMISTKPLTFYVSLNKATNPISHLRLVAESLGSIPPCTALMIVTTKKKRYEVRLSSNFSKTATVELFLKE